MKQFFYVVGAVLILCSCGEESFKKGDKGLEYKIISEGNGKKIAYGNFMQIHIKNFYKDAKMDTILGDSRIAGMPQIFPLDSTGFPPEYFKIVNQVKVGDSVVIRIKTDSLLKNTPQGLPPFIKKGQYFYTTLKVLNIFDNAQQADSAAKIAFETKMKADSINAIGQVSKDDKIITEYLAKNNIKAQKTPLGAYVEVIQQGSGSSIDSSVFVKVNYTGKTLAGKVFDSNTDVQFGHQQPYLVNMKGGVIKGWIEGLSILSKGAKAKFYIPSGLAYGAQGSGADIKPNDILIFDIEVVDVLTQAQAMAEKEKERKQMEELQKRYMDSMNKLQPDTTKKK